MNNDKSKFLFSLLVIIGGFSCNLPSVIAYSAGPPDNWATKSINWVMNSMLKAKNTLLEKAALNGKGDSLENPIVDSDITLAEALGGLDKNAPLDTVNKQALIDVYYYSFDNKIHKGQIVVDKRLAQDVEAVFDVILEEKFPIESAIPVSLFAWDDNSSMMANNTSAFNYRYVAGTTILSMHAKGWAVDINPKINPFIKGSKGEIVQPEGAFYDSSISGTLTSDSPVVKKFKELGWEWGGDWTTNSQGIPIKDYQHFEKNL